MNYIHSDRDGFADLVSLVSRETGISRAIIEKDYYVTLMLSELRLTEPGTVFKGGTSLSKCYGIINRFSEDIDLNLDNGTARPSETMRVRFSKEIRECADRIGLKPVNFGPDRPLRDKKRFLRYIYDYDPIFSAEGIKSRIEIETAFFIPSLPSETKTADSVIGNYLDSIGRPDLTEKFGLSRFPIKTQSLVRTYIDKLFAVADYYLDNNIKEHSRHLYDLYKIGQVLDIRDIPESLIRYVRASRAEYTTSRTSRSDYDLSEVIQEVLDKDVYKEDYQNVTKYMLYDDVTYDEVRQSLRQTGNIIRDMPCFKRSDRTMTNDLVYPEKDVEKYLRTDRYEQHDSLKEAESLGLIEQDESDMTGTDSFEVTDPAEEHQGQDVSDSHEHRETEDHDASDVTDSTDDRDDDL